MLMKTLAEYCNKSKIAQPFVITTTITIIYIHIWDQGKSEFQYALILTWRGQLHALFIIQPIEGSTIAKNILLISW